MAPNSTLFGMSSATHVSTLESFYSMHIVLATSCSHLSTACVSCVHWILCTPTGAGLNHAWGFETSTVQRKLNAMLGEYKKNRGGIPMRCCLFLTLKWKLMWIVNADAQWPTVRTWFASSWQLHRWLMCRIVWKVFGRGVVFASETI